MQTPNGEHPDGEHPDDERPAEDGRDRDPAPPAVDPDAPGRSLVDPDAPAIEPNEPA